jgi:hypothetical protein
MARLLRTIRSYLLPPLGRFLAKYAGHEGLYVTTETDHAEYVGLVEDDLRGTVDWFRDQGFVENPLAAYKDIEGTDISEKGSLTWRGPPGYLQTHSDSLPNSDLFADKQLHVILFELDGDRSTTAIFAHWEYSWAMHPIKHYRGIGVQDKRGARLCRDFLHGAHDDFHVPPMLDLLGSNGGENR